MNRRAFLSQGTLLAAQARSASVVIHPEPLFEISPYLYMQFMEPLGTTDSSVEAAWDYDKDDWREDFVKIVKELQPGVIRWGGIFSRYYKWREGIGPPEKRPLMRNYTWGGKETNRVGTAEFVDLCRRVGAEPLYCVNFLGDGIQTYRKAGRWGDAQEAADWVSWANESGNHVKLWQLGNETSYGSDSFTLEEAIEHTLEFAKAMKARDPRIQLIGWGDWERAKSKQLWAGEMLRRAGEQLDYIAIHMMGMRPSRTDTVLRGIRYQRSPEQAWQELLELSKTVEARVTEVEEVIERQGAKARLAITEGHLSLSPHNSNPILAEWLSAVYHARSLNIYQRHGKYVRIATAADFEGNRWTVNAVMLQAPRGAVYLMPVGAITRLFKRHNGGQGVRVKSAPSGLDIAASRTGNRFFLHVANTEYAKSVQAEFAVEGMAVTGGRVISIAPQDLRTQVNPDEPDIFRPQESALGPGPVYRWRFPAGSVSVVELDVSSG